MQALAGAGAGHSAAAGSRPLPPQVLPPSVSFPLGLHHPRAPVSTTPCLASTSDHSGPTTAHIPSRWSSRARRHRATSCNVASSSSNGVHFEGTGSGAGAAASSRVPVLHSLEDQAESAQHLTAGLQQIIREQSRPEAAGQGRVGAHTKDDGSSPVGSQPFTRATSHQASTAAHGTLPTEPKYKTVMLKVSGEALMGPHGFGVDPTVLRSVAEEVAAATRAGVKIAIVVGGGNFFRGAKSLEGLERATGDYVGMLATVMNALCLQSALEKIGVETRVQTAIEMREVAEPYIRRRAISHLREGRVVIFGAGTGNPFFTTDTAAALRAAEMNAEVFLKATKVDGVYDSDPFKNPNARRYDQLSYRQVCFDSLNVMDETAITLCKENNIPVIVFNIMEKGNICKAALGLPVGTVVDNTAPAHTEGSM